MSGAREALLRSLAPEVVDAFVQLVDERVGAGTEDTREPCSPWLSLAEAADYLRMSERTIQRLVGRGRVRSATIGRRRLVHRDDLDKAAAGEETAPTAPPRRR